MPTENKIPKHVLDAAARRVKARNDAITTFAQDLAGKGRCDAQLAPIWAEKLRHTYASTPETIYPELQVANGQVLPIDSSVDPATLEWEYYMIDSGGYCDWIDEDGDVMPSAFVKARRFTGKHAPIGGGYEYTIFDLERAAKANVPLNSIKAKADKRANDEKTEWVWMFGDSAKQIEGLVLHPNMPTSLAAVGASTSRLPANKTNDEILADFVTLIDQPPEQSIEAHHVTDVYMAPSLMRLMRTRKIAGTATGMVSLWDVLLDMFKGDDTGQGKVSFHALNYCDADRRSNPKTGTDTSGIAGDFLLALPAKDVDSLCFVKPRAYTQLPPEQHGFKVMIKSHSDIGGCKMVYPLSCHVMLYGTT